jgi:hypothetical protein
MSQGPAPLSSPATGRCLLPSTWSLKQREAQDLCWDQIKWAEQKEPALNTDVCASHTHGPELTPGALSKGEFPGC